MSIYHPFNTTTYNRFKPFFFAFDFFFFSIILFDFLRATLDEDESAFVLPGDFFFAPSIIIVSAEFGRHFGCVCILVYNFALFEYAL